MEAEKQSVFERLNKKKETKKGAKKKPDEGKESSNVQDGATKATIKGDTISISIKKQEEPSGEKQKKRK